MQRAGTYKVELILNLREDVAHRGRVGVGAIEVRTGVQCLERARHVQWRDVKERGMVSRCRMRSVCGRGVGLASAS
jgi:hypothetical protein